MHSKYNKKNIIFKKYNSNTKCISQCTSRAQGIIKISKII